MFSGKPFIEPSKIRLIEIMLDRMCDLQSLIAQAQISAKTNDSN